MSVFSILYNQLDPPELKKPIVCSELLSLYIGLHIEIVGLILILCCIKSIFSANWKVRCKFMFININSYKKVWQGAVLNNSKSVVCIIVELQLSLTFVILQLVHTNNNILVLTKIKKENLCSSLFSNRNSNYSVKSDWLTVCHSCGTQLNMAWHEVSWHGRCVWGRMEALHRLADTGTGSTQPTELTCWHATLRDCTPRPHDTEHCTPRAWLVSPFFDTCRTKLQDEKKSPSSYFMFLYTFSVIMCMLQLHN